MILIDGHLDLAMCALAMNRDLRMSAHEIRQVESGQTGMGRGAGTVGFPDMRQGQVAISVATVLARVNWSGPPQFGAELIEFGTQDVACAFAVGQLAYYQQLEREGVLTILRDGPAVESHLRAWAVDPDRTPFGIVLSMEGADPIVGLDQLAVWSEAGLRVLSLAHYGRSRYAHGTSTVGPVTADGWALLAEMERIGTILDVTHLCDESFWDALRRFNGRVVATHSNCRALCPGERQIDDDQLRELIRRDGVIGAVVNAWMLEPGFDPGVSSNAGCRLEMVVDQIDHVCQLAGDARHAAIGSDLDGGYGTEECPHDFDTIADLQRIPAMLAARGYRDDDVAAVMHGNWARVYGSPSAQPALD